jgi:hypothetical protein
MAYMSQATKAEICAELKKVMPVGWKYTVGVSHHSTIVLNIAKAPVDLVKIAREKAGYQGIGGHIQVNPHWMHEHFKGTEVEAIMKKIQNVLYGHKDYYDDSDPMTDYFSTAYYVNVNIGKWNKPFEVCAPVPAPKAEKVEAAPINPFAKFMAAVLTPVEL